MTRKNRIKILLIEANAPWLDFRRDMSDLEQIMPPIGLMYIGSFLRHKLKEQVEVRIVSRFVDCPEPARLSALLKAFKPDAVGIRSLNMYRKVFHETAALVKEWDPACLVVAGGPYASMDWEHAVSDRNVDYAAIGEGEITMYEIAVALLNGGDVSAVPGLAFFRNGSAVRSNDRPFIRNLDSLPFPDYGLISFDRYDRYLSYGYNKRKQGIILTSRGCPYRCIYCNKILGATFRARSPHNIFDEIQQLYERRGVSDFYIVDDNFNLDLARAKAFFDLVIRSGLKIRMYLPTGIRGDIGDTAFFDAMAAAGVVFVAFAVETASPRLQKEIRKNIDLDAIARNIHYVCSKDIMVNVFVMVGFPGETVEEAYGTVEYLKQFKKITLPSFFAVKYFPSTEAYRSAFQAGCDMASVADAYEEPYHILKHSVGSAISDEEFQRIKAAFLNEVFLSRERLSNAIAIQRRFYSEQEMRDFYSFFFRKRIIDIDREVMRYAK